MKIVCIHNAINSGEDLWMTERSDSSVLRNNDNFYMPTFSNRMECTVGYMLRVTRLAKCINEKFAPIREKRIELQKDTDKVYDIINEGNKKAVAEAEKVMQKVRDAVNI